MNTTAPWRTFSIFISSTFSDMQAERDHLKHIVFPRVEEQIESLKAILRESSGQRGSDPKMGQIT